MPQAQNLTLYQGDDYVATVTIMVDSSTPYDLTGCTAMSQIRVGPADKADLLVEIEAVVIDAPNGVIRISLTHDQTSILTGALYVWDMMIIGPSGGVRTILAGNVYVTKEVTRRVEGGTKR